MINNFVFKTIWMILYSILLIADLTGVYAICIKLFTDRIFYHREIFGDYIVAEIGIYFFCLNFPIMVLYFIYELYTGKQKRVFQIFQYLYLILLLYSLFVVFILNPVYFFKST